METQRAELKDRLKEALDASYIVGKWQCWNFNDSKGFRHLRVASSLLSENALNYRMNTNTI